MLSFSLDLSCTFECISGTCYSDLCVAFGAQLAPVLSPAFTERLVALGAYIVQDCISALPLSFSTCIYFSAFSCLLLSPSRFDQVKMAKKGQLGSLPNGLASKYKVSGKHPWYCSRLRDSKAQLSFDLSYCSSVSFPLPELAAHPREET